MPRIVEITVPTERAGALLEGLRPIGAVLGIRVQHGTSVQPPGDIITVEVTNRALPQVMLLLDEHSIGADGKSSFTTSEPTSTIPSSRLGAVVRDSSDVPWEEMELVIGKESNMTVNALAVMAISGALATAGLSGNTLHYVLAAMVLAPGFEPFVRIALGVVAGSAAWRRGVVDVLRGYAALLAGAVVAAVLLVAFGNAPLGSTAAYLPPGSLIRYWSQFTAASLMVSAVASIAGAILIATNRSVLTAGVMIALALVPSAALIGMALVTADLDLASRGLLRWLVDAALVSTGALLVFGWKRRHTHQRKLRL